ncbi:hypothetical protein [Prochlorothrix hollandica]|uniref:hypothetical protein n=1 Tax=Prochlorothrix hollandica TaxID=1223 RepID=UPI0011D282F8|nr:hypothetical protein [Prochlorothrix hollandica]
MVAPVGGRQEGRQEGRHGDENPSRGRWFPGEMHPVDPALTGDRGAATLLTFPLNSYRWLKLLGWCAPGGGTPHDPFRTAVFG